MVGVDSDSVTLISAILQTMRKEFAKHYLADWKLSPGQIPFLLGRQDSNSLLRA